MVIIESAGEVLMAKSELTASAAKDGGNITISKPGLLFMNRGKLSANAVYGQGGYISVVADTFLPSVDSLITASSEYGAQEVVETDIG